MASTLQDIKAAQNNLINFIGQDAFACIVALVQFILADPLLRSVIIGFLETLKAQIALAKTSLEATIAQLDVTLALVETEVSALSAVTSVADGLGNRFPLEIFMRCPLTANMITAVTQGLSSGTGGITNYIQKYKNLVRDLQYEVSRLTALINSVNASIQQCDLFTSQINAIETLINAVADFPGTVKLPLP